MLSGTLSPFIEVDGFYFSKLKEEEKMKIKKGKVDKDEKSE